jgi:phosphoribosylformylglycinamidine cyclo-ligase
LLEPHRCYLAEIDRLQAAGIVIHGLAHITGGGLLDNPPRIFPPGLGARLQRGSWPEPPVFGLIQRLGAVSAPEMFRVFNMGLGMLAVVSQEQAAAAQTAVPALLLVGQITQGASHVEIAE